MVSLGRGMMVAGGYDASKGDDGGADAFLSKDTALQSFS